jgi:hypothetical protein
MPSAGGPSLGEARRPLKDGSAIRAQPPGGTTRPQGQNYSSLSSSSSMSLTMAPSRFKPFSADTRNERFGNSTLRMRARASASRDFPGQRTAWWLKYTRQRGLPSIRSSYTAAKPLGEAQMPMIKLGCLNCGAPLDIGADLDTFACGFCGTQQRVERMGGAVALKKVETAMKAVQRGTDRTAAELAMPRLQRELDGAVAEKASVLAGEKERIASAVRGRRQLTFVVFFAVLIGGPLVLAGVDAESPKVAIAGSVLWLLASVVVPVFVYRRTKLPKDRSTHLTADVDARLNKVQAHIAANRAILEQLP